MAPKVPLWVLALRGHFAGSLFSPPPKGAATQVWMHGSFVSTDLWDLTMCPCGAQGWWGIKESLAGCQDSHRKSLSFPPRHYSFGREINGLCWGPPCGVWHGFPLAGVVTQGCEPGVPSGSDCPRWSALGTETTPATPPTALRCVCFVFIFV